METSINIHTDLEPQTLNNASYINRYTMKKVSNIQKTINVLRYPRLDTIIMVENFIKKNDGEFKKKKLWESLPKKMMYQTFCVIISYLESSQKISIDSEGKIGWIFYPKIAQKYYSRIDLGRK